MVQKKFCLSTFFYYFLFFLTFVLLSTGLNAQNKLWEPVGKHLIAKEKVANLKTYQLFQLNKSLFLEKATPTLTASRQSPLPITIAFPIHTLSTIDLIASPIMAEELKAKYPSIQSYQISSKENTALHGRISWTAKGLYGHLVDDTASFFIENAEIEGEEATYLVYQASDIIANADQRLICGNHALKTIQQASNQIQIDTNLNTDLKTFRIAITATEQFTNATGGTIESSLSAIVNSLTSLNVIYERDAGIRFLLHENADQLIFTDSLPSPFDDPGGAFELLTSHTALLDSLLGPDSYDVGHVFAADCTGGVSGVAFLASVCSMETKARGVSCIFDGNIGDFRRTLYHEVGHQLGANHTWSNCGQSVNESQRNAATAVEPGGGSTIMSYGGVCGPPFNVVGVPHDNLHGISIQEISNALASDTIGCFQQIPTENTQPIVTVKESGFSIPIATPFELGADAFDAENTALTYSWEQFDTGAVSEVGFPIESAPSFVTFRPSREPIRLFPRATTIILNKMTSGEVLPDTTRQLTFGVTVRDNQAGGGSTAFAEVAFMATAEAGPFLVLQPDSINIVYEMGDSIVVRWDVANTNAEPVNCANVDVYLSFNNGQDFPKLLAAGVPNNGEIMVTLPDTTTNRARIKIKCSDNIFFDMSDNRFRIVEQLLSSTINLYTKPIQLYPNPASDKIMLEFSEVIIKTVDLSIYDALGRTVLYEKQTPNNHILQLNTSHLENGVYLLKGKIDEQFFSKRFIVNE